MKKQILTFLFILISFAAFSKGAAGTYFIKGKAYDSNKMLLVNSIILMDFYGKIEKIKTDAAGNFKLEIHWGTACPSGVSDIEKENEKLNPKFIKRLFLTLHQYIWLN